VPVDAPRASDPKVNATYEQQEQQATQAPESPKVHFARDGQPERSQRPVEQEEEPRVHFADGTAPASHKRAPSAAYVEVVEDEELVA